MKKNMLFALALIVTGMSWTSCDSDDEMEKSALTPKRVIETSALGYWSHEKFIELEYGNSTQYAVVPRAGETPVAMDEAMEILHSLGVEEATSADHSQRIMVTACEMPSHPSLFVSRNYQLIGQQEDEGGLMYLLPTVVLKVKEGCSISDVLEKYGDYFTLTEMPEPSFGNTYCLPCNLSTSDELLHLSNKIYAEPSVEGCAPDMLVSVILD